MYSDSKLVHIICTNSQDQFTNGMLYVCIHVFVVRSPRVTEHSNTDLVCDERCGRLRPFWLDCCVLPLLRLLSRFCQKMGRALLRKNSSCLHTYIVHSRLSVVLYCSSKIKKNTPRDYHKRDCSLLTPFFIDLGSRIV